MKNAKKLFQKTRYLFLLMLFGCLTVSAQQQQGITVRGQIVDSNDEPVIGASIIVKGSPSIGTVSDIDGNFALLVPNVNATLVVSYIGMTSQEIKATGRESLRVVLNDNLQLLDEVVVVGFGQQKKASVVGAITQTSAKVLERTGGVSDLGSALTGNLPGVITTASTGMPGDEDPRILIRGMSSWNNQTPLILVDGIERPMSGIDVNSVASISVLKDASATAVYGVKGANGVVLITTKRGQEGKTTIDVSASMTLKTPSKLPNKLDSYDAFGLRNNAVEHELGLAPASWGYMMPEEMMDKYRNPADLTERERYPNIDWADWMFKDYAFAENVNVSASGGTKFVKYYAAIDYQHEGDLFKEYDNGRGYQTTYGYNRVNMRSNLDFNLTKTTLLKANIAGSHGVRKGPRTAYEYNIWGSAYTTPPNVFMPRYEDGTWGYDPINNANNSVAGLALAPQNTRTTTRLTTDFVLEQKLDFFLKGLSAKASISWDNVFLEENRGVATTDAALYKYIDPVTGNISYNPSVGSHNFDFREQVNWMPEGGTVNNGATERHVSYSTQVDYIQTFGKHTVSAMGLFSRQERAKGNMVPHYREDWAFRTTYNYADRYFLEYNGAYNGSDKFSDANRFAFFNSGAVGWMISEEKFMKGLKFIDMLKLRASYGEIGNDQIGDEWDASRRWLYMTQWALNGNIRTGQYNVTSPYTFYSENTVGNENIHWEVVEKLNLGIDYSFIDGLLAGSVEIFRDNRSDILINGSDRATPSYFGGTTRAPWANLGKVKNSGYEIELRLNKVLENDLRLWANMNMTHARNEIITRDEGELLPEYQKRAGKPIGQTYTYVEHGYTQTMDDVYGSTAFESLDNQKLPGDYAIIDYNGDGIINSYDQIPYGYSGDPQNSYSASLGFDYKGWSFFTQFYGVNNVTRQVVFSSFGRQQLIAYDEGSRWTKYNTNPDVPMPRFGTTTNGYYDATRYFYDASYIRLKNIELAYTFTDGWITCLGVSNLKLYINGNNLWVWTRMPDDREANFAGTGWASQGAYPTIKRINFGLKFTL
jgi:TonB-linked SusC/RagA family outer membrane protein